jgi:hypothetical protein
LLAGRRNLLVNPLSSLIRVDVKVVEMRIHKVALRADGIRVDAVVVKPAIVLVEVRKLVTWAREETIVVCTIEDIVRLAGCVASVPEDESSDNYKRVSW